MRIISRATQEQVSLAEAYTHLKIDTVSAGSPPAVVSDEDDWLNLFIPAVRKFTERYLGRALVPTTVLGVLDEFPEGNFTLQGGPVLDIQSIVYTDEDGVEQTVDASWYSLNLDEQLARVVLTDGQAWPGTFDMVSAVRVTYVIGNSYTAESPDTAPIDEDIKAAMLIILGWLYREREGMAVQQFWTAAAGDAAKVYIPPAAKLLLGMPRLRRGFA